MLAVLDVPFVDTSPDSLALHCGLDRLPALGTLVVEHEKTDIELRILSASHQVVVNHDRQQLLSETVACLGEQTRGSGSIPLPSDRSEQSRTCVHDFSSSRAVMTPSQFEYEVGRIVQQATSDERSLVGQFPGSPLAVTVMTVTAMDTTSAQWTSRHAYPQHLAIVETQSICTFVREYVPA